MFFFIPDDPKRYTKIVNLEDVSVLKSYPSSTMYALNSKDRGTLHIQVPSDVIVFIGPDEGLSELEWGV